MPQGPEGAGRGIYFSIWKPRGCPEIMAHRFRTAGIGRAWCNWPGWSRMTRARKIRAWNTSSSPGCWPFAREASRIHGITTYLAKQRGADLGAVPAEISADLARARVLIAHNLDYDEKIVGGTFSLEAFPEKWIQPITNPDDIDVLSVQSLNIFLAPRIRNHRWKRPPGRF
jgi:hypothetical protein